MIFWLSLIFFAILFVPITFKTVEERLELFLLLAGVASVTATRSWSWELLRHAAVDPWGITAAVLVAGTFFHFLSPLLERSISAFGSRFGPGPLAALLVAGSGLISGVATALVSALALAEILSRMALSRKSEIRLAVLGCFAIGLGAVLTPLGEPLASITMARLRGGRHILDFWFLFHLMAKQVVPLILVLGVLAWLSAVSAGKGRPSALRAESYRELVFRALKVYIFMAGLELIGAGFNPATGDLLGRMPAGGLYWASLVSAVLDNASLAAAGLSPNMSAEQLKFFLLGMMISGGMLVPGNFPNIVCAAKLKISMREWAVDAVPLGLATLVACYLVLLV